MTTFRHWRIAVGLLLAIAGASTRAASLQISQVADRGAHVAVFLCVHGAATPAVAAASARPSSRVASASLAPVAVAAPTATVALGNLPLNVESIASLDAAEGLSLVLAVDVSASLGDATFDTVKHQLRALLEHLPPRSRVAVVAIGTEVRTVQGFGSPASAMAAVEGLSANAPETALYESMLAAQEMAAHAGPELPLRRAVLVVTDGLDDSRHGVGRDETMQKISRGDAPVFAMALTPRRVPAAQLEAVKTLAQMARASGGAFVQSTPPEAGSGLDGLLSQARHVQVLTLDCSACSRDGAERALQVTLQQGGESMSDEREIRLLATRAEAHPASAPASAEASTHGVAPANGPARIAPWVWAVVAGAAVLLVAAIAWFVRRKPDVLNTKQTLLDDSLDPRLHDFDEHERREESPRDEPRERTVGNGATLTLDIAGERPFHFFLAGRMTFGRAAQPPGTMGDYFHRLENDPNVSSRHAAIVFEDPNVILRDLGSSNGTFLNGTRIVRAEPLHDRDVILVGHTEIRVYFSYI